jgi:large subunit ribosomal protein L7/L12
MWVGEGRRHTRSLNTNKGEEQLEMAKKDVTAALKKIDGLSDEEKMQVMIESIKGMTVLSLSELVKQLEEVFGVSAAVPMVAGAVPAAAGGDAQAGGQEEQTEFDIILKDVGGEKVKVIKAIREITSLGLRESKELVDGAPSDVLKGVSKEEADAAKAKLEEVGATAEVK